MFNLPAIPPINHPPVPPGTPWGIERHLPIVSHRVGVPPRCSCGWRGHLGGPYLAEHIGAEALRLGVPNGTHPGTLT